MKQLLRSGFLRIVACAVSRLGLRAQTVIYSTDFPDDQGWTLVTSCSLGAWWAVDTSPANVLGSPSWRSAPYSLNFNNGADIGAAGIKTCGTATSPQIDLSVTTGTVALGFWCNWETELSGPCGYDSRYVLVLNGSGSVAQQCVNTASCGGPGQWHFHSMALDASWGTVQVQFGFNTLDGLDNEGAGWFVDDLEVIEECTPPVTYCTTKLNSQGCFPLICTTGTPSLGGTGTAFRIWAGSVLNQKVGLMIWGRAPAATPFGGGTLCVASPVTRTASQNSGGTSLPAVDCTGTYLLQFTPAMMSQAGLVEGDDVYSQYWSRDNGFAPPDNVGLTAGVHWKVCP
jgi:hypothetical protein